jgi:hypothetical protein
VDVDGKEYLNKINTSIPWRWCSAGVYNINARPFSWDNPSLRL